MYFRTLSFSCLNKYHDLFYKNKTKVVPLNKYQGRIRRRIFSLNRDNKAAITVRRGNDYKSMCYS